MINNNVQNSFNEALDCLERFVHSADNIKIVSQAADVLTKTFQSDNKVISCGNGGSMCDAMHFAEEFTGKFRKERNPLPATAISDASYLTCVANDYGFDQVFSRYVEAHGTKNDVLLAISTSGNSPNILNAVKIAQRKGMKVIALLGKDGGEIKKLADYPIIVPGNTSDRIQEIHIKIIHIIIEAVERNLFPKNY